MNLAIGGALALLFALGVPVFATLALTAVFGIELFTNLPLLLVAQRMFATLDSFPLLAVPLFILSGNLMAAGGISDRLVDFAKSMVGGVQGGLAIACVVTCMIFASVSGSSVATTFAIGAILIPAMARHGYPVPTAAAVQASSAELGVLIPPSIPLILFGVSTETSIGQLFIAGFGPGLLIGGTLMLFLLLYCRWKGLGKDDGRDRMPFGRALARAGVALVMPVVVLGGIYGGVFTPTEASAVAVVYALLAGAFIYRRLTLPVLAVVLRDTVRATSVIMLIIAAAGLFSFLLTRTGLPNEVAQWVRATFESKAAFLLAVNVFLFIVGMFLETSAAILVLAPLLTPIAVSFGVDPVHFGLIVVVNLALGMITPPVGVNLFAACAVARISLDRIIPALLPFVLVVLACLMAVTYIPEVSLGLRDLVYPAAAGS